MEDTREYQAYADYNVIKTMLIYEHKTMIDLFWSLSWLNLYRKNYNTQASQTKFITLRCQLQAQISKVATLYKDYKSIKRSSKDKIKFNKLDVELNKVLKLISEAEKNAKLLSFEAMHDCREALGTAQYILGLNDIEMEKSDPSSVMVRTRGY